MDVGLALLWAVPMTALRVVVAEDQLLLREGLTRLLTENGFEVVGHAGDAVDLRRQGGRAPPRRRCRRCADATRQHRRRPAGGARNPPGAPGTGILVLSQFRDEAYAMDLIGNDACGVGYLLKDRIADVGSFADAVRRVATGGSALDPEIVALMVGRRRKHDPLDALTPRERQVLTLMAEGKSNLGIAESLRVTLAAVEKHVGRIFAKLGLSSEPLEHRRVMAALTLLRPS